MAEIQEIEIKVGNSTLKTTVELLPVTKGIHITLQAIPTSVESVNPIDLETAIKLAVGNQTGRPVLGDVEVSMSRRFRIEQSGNTLAINTKLSGTIIATNVEVQNLQLPDGASVDLCDLQTTIEAAVAALGLQVKIFRFLCIVGDINI